MNTEAKLLNAICVKKDIAPALAAPDIDDLFIGHKDVWLKLKFHFYKYKAVPTVDLVTEWFPDFDADTAIDLEPKYVIDEMRNERIESGLEDLAMKIANAVNKGDHPPGKILQLIQKDLSSLGRFSNGIKDLDLSNAEASKRHYEVLQERVKENDGALGIKTGFDSIDASYPTGMAGGHFIVCIGWPGNKKSFFSELVAINVYRQGKRPMIISLEMSPESMRDRIYTLMGAGTWRMSDLSRASIDLDAFEGWGNSALTEQPFVVISNEGVGAMTPNVVQAKIDQYKPDFIVIDYLQLMENNGRSSGETERVRAVSRELKMLALQNNIPIFAIVSATMNDKQDRDIPPMLHHVANSKQIEFDADVAVSVHTFKEEDGHGITEIAARKNRHGPDFCFNLSIDPENGIVEERFD